MREPWHSLPGLSILVCRAGEGQAELALGTACQKVEEKALLRKPSGAGTEAWWPSRRSLQVAPWGGALRK